MTSIVAGQDRETGSPMNATISHCCRRRRPRRSLCTHPKSIHDSSSTRDPIGWSRTLLMPITDPLVHPETLTSTAEVAVLIPVLRLSSEAVGMLRHMLAYSCYRTLRTDMLARLWTRHLALAYLVMVRASMTAAVFVTEISRSATALSVVGQTIIAQEISTTVLESRRQLGRQTALVAIRT